MSMLLDHALPADHRRSDTHNCAVGEHLLTTSHVPTDGADPMTWPKMLALSLVLVACTEQLVEAITGRGDPTSNRARRKPTKPAPQRSERQRRPERPPTITAAWGNTVGATA